MSDRTCSFGGCGRKHEGRGWCSAHYQQWKRTGKVHALRIQGDDDARFAQYVRTLPNGCVEWTGYRDKNGYGHFSANSKPVLAHRWRWQRDNGPLGLEFDLDHYRYPERGCIGPSCVLHVRPTTRRENSLRGQAPAAWNLAKTHCPKGHPYSGDNLYVYPPTGGRACKKCSKDAARRAQNYKGNLPHKERTHCPRGHAYDEENTRYGRNGRSRYCKACHRIGERARRAKPQT